jgi:hypothetical protein
LTLSRTGTPAPAGNRGSNIRFVQTIGRNDPDLVVCAIEILDRRGGCNDRALAANISVESGHVAEHAEFDL